MSRLPLRFKSTLRAFAAREPVSTWSEEGSYVKGVWSKFKTNDACIRAIVLTMQPEELQMYAQGNISQGGIVLQTSEQLYFCDITEAGQTGRQSFVSWNGYIYKVVSPDLSAGNSDNKLFHALRYVSYDAT